MHAQGDSSKFRLKAVAEGQIFIKALADELFIDANQHDGAPLTERKPNHYTRLS